MSPLPTKLFGADKERDRLNLARLRATAESRHAQLPTRIAIALLASYVLLLVSDVFWGVVWIAVIFMGR